MASGFFFSDTLEAFSSSVDAINLPVGYPSTSSSVSQRSIRGREGQKQAEERGVRLHTLTWNVGGKKPPARMEDALALTSVPLPDLIGIGLQEVNPRPSEIREWVDFLTWTLADYDYVRSVLRVKLQEGDCPDMTLCSQLGYKQHYLPLSYLMVKHRQQLGVVTLVYVQRSLLPYCTSFETEITKTGFGGWWGNKGGVSVRLDIFGINLIIVNCHLAAHQDNVADRIVDYDSILDDQKFKDPDVENILDHDYVFWIGDLNFRIDNMSRAEVDRAIEAKKYVGMLGNDQLNRCREERLIFEDFEEMKITFPPTYKFDTGTDTYDTSSKRRIPAWCDRVLWHTYNTDYDGFCPRVDPIEYTSHPKYRHSDHKPVTATFFFTVFPKPPLNPVQFETQKSWPRNTAVSLRYCVSRHTKTSSSDWIGLYRANFHQFDKYLSYTWALQGAEKNRQGVTVTFSARALSVKPGQYCLCYLTRKYSLMGISNVFEIV